MPVREAVHQDPVWREKSDFIIATCIDSVDTEISTEQLWARRVEARRFELCCIPFFACDIALGDVVETDDEFLVRRVLAPSGRYVFRAYFGKSMHPRDEVTGHLASMGALLEWSPPDLLAIDARDLEHARSIADVLQESEHAGHLIFETGRS